jgi:hypothetical protein
MEVKHILSEKGKQLFVVNGAKFCQARKLSDNRIRWRCVQKFCTAKIYTQGNILNYFLRGCTLFGCLPRLFPRW